MLPPDFCGQHLFDRELGDIDETFQVGCGEIPEVLGGIVRERLDEEDASVIDERVDCPKFAHCNIDNSLRCCALTDVSVHQGQLA
jgi:hypothetical protein